MIIPDEPYAAIPFMEARTLSGHRKAVSLPFSDTTQPIITDPASFSTLWGHLIEHGRSRHWKTLELRGGATFLYDQPPVSSYFAHELNLEAGSDAVFKGFSPTCIRGIRKAEKAGLTVKHETSREALQIYYKMHCLTRKKQGVPPQPRLFFENIHHHLFIAGKGFVTLVYDQSIPVAGAIFLHVGDKAMYKFGASDPGKLANRPNNLVMWKAIQHLINNGMKSLHFGRTDLSHEGLRRFKLGWGARETHLLYYRYNVDQNCFIKKPETTNPFASLITAMFRHTPIVVSRFIGKHLYKYAG